MVDFTPGEMGCATNIGKYRLGLTVGQGTFAKVKVAVNTETGQSVAIKIIDKQMVMDNKLMEQVFFHVSLSIFLSHFCGAQCTFEVIHGNKLAADNL